MFSLMGGISAKGKGPGGITVSQNQQTCADEPCKNGGSCLASEEFNRGFYCRCTEGFTGIYCDIDVPEVKCGESYMEVSLQKQMILEHGLEDNVENIGFKESYYFLPKSRGTIRTMTIFRIKILSVFLVRLAHTFFFKTSLFGKFIPRKL